MTKFTPFARLGHDLTHCGVSAWLLSGLLLAYYLLLYFTELLTPPAKSLGLADKWTLDAVLYTLAIVVGGAFVLRKYRHNRYQVVRTSSVMLLQVILAFALPLILRQHHQQDYYFSYFWPLTFDYWNPNVILNYPLPLILYSFCASLFLVPLLGFFFGKRWYCSWVCGCGGLANTAGDSFRHLSSKSSLSWAIERLTIYSVFALCLLLTALLFISYGIGNHHPALAAFTYRYQTFYYFGVTVMLSGVIGTAVYPIGGTRIWCRNFCPMAALLGLVQRLGRFRITVKKDMCISCGMCSTYCEMGIDVRSYAQANRSFTRASCVGCGICADVCPRGVLRLESTTPPQFTMATSADQREWAALAGGAVRGSACLRAALVIPALNEEEVIGEMLAHVPQGLFATVLVVDNGSSDRTAAIAARSGAQVVHEVRRGYGMACLRALATLPESIDVLLFMQADLSENPAESRSLLAPIERGEADLVIGSRTLGCAARGALLPHQRFGNWLATRLIRCLYRRRYTDLGAFRAIRRSSLMALGMRPSQYAWTVEMQVRALEVGLRVIEIPVSYRPRLAGTPKISGQVRSSVAAGLTILTTIVHLWAAHRFTKKP